MEDVYGQGVVVGGGDGSAAGEEDAFETAYALTVAGLVADDFLLDEFEDWGPEAGCVGYGADLQSGVEAAEVGEFIDDGLGDLGVTGAEGEDFGKGYEPVFGCRFCAVAPGVAAFGLFDVEEESEGGGVLGLAEVDAQDGFAVVVLSVHRVLEGQGVEVGGVDAFEQVGCEEAGLRAEEVAHIFLAEVAV